MDMLLRKNKSCTHKSFCFLFKRISYDSGGSPIAGLTHPGDELWGDELWGDELWGDELWGDELWGDELWTGSDIALQNKWWA